MNQQQITTAVALFFRPEQCACVPYEWLGRARSLFLEHRLSAILFTAYGGNFVHDDCYVYAGPGGDLTMWGEQLPAREEELIAALQSGAIESVVLDSPRSGANSRSDSRTEVEIDVADGTCYVAVDQELVSDSAVLLRRAYGMTDDLFDVCYGFAYRMPLAQEPGCYALGIASTTLADFREMLRLRHEGIQREKSPDEIWRDEVHEQRRFLDGLFRGAYPANVLSEAHVRAADLTSHPIGKLSQLDSSLWLWELADSEIPAAQSMLEERKLLVSQAAQA